MGILEKASTLAVASSRVRREVRQAGARAGKSVAGTRRLGRVVEVVVRGALDQLAELLLGAAALWLVVAVVAVGVGALAWSLVWVLVGSGGVSLPCG